MSRMAKEKTRFQCAECGGISPKWLGKCPQCEAWNTLQEVRDDPAAGASGSPHRFAALAGTQPVATLSEIVAAEVPRTPTGQDELDRALGGGIVPGGVVLIGGDPGIGKSTLLLQAADSLSRQFDGTAPAAGSPGGVLYITGEESGAQVALRARRLGLEGRRVRVLAEIALERILAALQQEAPAFCVIDSIQTLYSSALTSAPGSVAQVRECAAQLTRHAKAAGTSLVLVGHVTKDGTLAGPRVLEHIVDTVLVEIQALVDAGGPSPRRLSVGLERDRLAMLLAVLHRHAGVSCMDQDVFVNAVGGVRISEPAADLAVLLAIQGSLRGKPLPRGFIAFGEVGLAGEVRPAPRGRERLKEAAKLGFSVAVVPKANAPKKPVEGLTIHPVQRIEQAIEVVRGLT